MYWFKVFINDVDARSASLSATAMGCYARLCNKYIRNMGPLADDDRTLARFCHVPLKDWPPLRDELLDVFKIVDGVWIHDDLDKQIATFHQASTRNRDNRGGDQCDRPDRLEDAS